MGQANAGERIKQLREAKGWSQQTLAHYAGVTTKTVSIAEGNGPSRRATLTAIAVGLGITLAELLGGTELEEAAS